MTDQSIKCEQCEQHLFEFHEGRLAPNLSVQIDQHLRTCDECSALLNDIWQMNLVSTRWQDESLPDMDRQRNYPGRQIWQWPQMLATAASVLALVLVLTDTHFVRNNDAITLKVGRSGYVSDTTLDAFRQDRDAAFDERFQRLTAQQVASSQLMLRSLLETSRAERREDFTTLVTYWNTAQTRQVRQTREDLQYLILAQAEDDKDIKQLNDAFQEINLRRGKDM